MAISHYFAFSFAFAFAFSKLQITIEAMEEGQNRVKFLKSVEEGEEDRIGALPDCLISEILSRLPTTKDAIRTGTLSKRWKHSWTSVTTLIFTYSLHDHHPLSQYRENPNLRSDFISNVDKTLNQCRQSKLKNFVVCTCYDTRFESKFNKWIRYAISCNVEELNWKFWGYAGFRLDQLFFTSSSFTKLTLGSCILNPSGVISWKNLRSLCIGFVELNEDSIESILSGSPVLETFVLKYCYGYKRLDITSKSVKNLEVCGYLDQKNGICHDLIVEINAPNIVSLTIQICLSLWKLLLLNVSSVVVANLDYKKLMAWYAKMHKEEEEEEEMLKGFILNLRHVKELKIGSICSKVVSRLEAKGFVFPSNIKLPE